MAFDKPTLKTLRAEMQTALQAVVDNNPDLAIVVGNCTFDPDTATFKVSVKRLGAAGKPAAEEGDFRRYAHFFDLAPDDFGKTFRAGAGRTAFRIVGLRPKAHKNPIIVEREDGKKFVYPADAVKRGLAMAASNG